MTPPTERNRQLGSDAETVFFEHPEYSREDWRRFVDARAMPEGRISPELAADLTELLAEFDRLDDGEEAPPRSGRPAAATPSRANDDTLAMRSAETDHHGAAAQKQPVIAVAAGSPLRISGQAGCSYELLEQVGTGGHAVVYRGRQREPLQRQVAVKVYYGSTGDLREARDLQGLREVRAIQKLEHPGICQVFDAGITPWNQPFLVMEFLDGQPVVRFAAERDLSIPERIQLFREVLDVVIHAHAAGVIHRDIKPGNVLVQAASGRVKLIDFSIARLSDTAATATAPHTVGGTRGYCSPEQAGLIQHPTDARSDLYALGCLLFELLTGEQAFADETAPEATPPADLSRRLDAISPRLAAEMPGCHLADLAELIERCVERDPADRPATAEALRSQLDAWQAGRRLPWPSLAVWLRRRQRGLRQTAVAGGAVAMAVLASVIVLLPAKQTAEPVPATTQRTPQAVAEHILVSTLGPATDPAMGTPLGKQTATRQVMLDGIQAKLDALPPAERMEAGRSLVKLAFDASLFDVCRFVTESLLAELAGTATYLPVQAELMSYLLAQNVLPEDREAVLEQADRLVDELREHEQLATPEGMRLLVVFSHILKETGGDDGAAAADALLAPVLADPAPWLAVDAGETCAAFVNAMSIRIKLADPEGCVAVAARLRSLAAFPDEARDETFARMVLLEADALGRIGRSEDAVATLAAAVASDRPLPRGRRNTLVVEQAEILERIGRLEEALAALEQNATSETPSRVVDANWMFHTSLQEGRVLLKLGRPEEGVPLLQRAARLVDEWGDTLIADASVFAYVWLAEGLDDLGRADAAVAAFKTAASNLATRCDAGQLPVSMGEALGGRIEERIDEITVASAD